jgi:predicted permease
MQQIALIIAPTFFAIALGYLFGRVSHSGYAALVDVAMYIAVPCLVFSSLYSSTIVIGEAAKLWASCLLILAGTLLMAWLFFRLTRKKHSGLYLPIVLANLINIPLPILYLAFGDEGVALAVLFYIPQGLLIYSLGVYVGSGQTGLRQGLGVMLRTPLLYAAVIGLALNLAGVPLPTVVTSSLKFMGQAAVPLMLLVLGVNVGRIRITDLSLTLAASVIRMGGGLCMGLLAVWLLGITGIPRAVVLFESAMPAAIFVSMLCTKYQNEAELVSSVVLATTLMAVPVIPVLLYFLT